MLDNKNLIKDKNIIDVGSGCGASAIAAVKSGAEFVLANDIDIVSLAAININSKLNNVELFTSNKDLIGKEIDKLDLIEEMDGKHVKWDIILIGDLFYDSDISSKLFLWFIDLIEKGKTILIGDPGRHGLNVINEINLKCKLIKLTEYHFQNIEHNGFPNAGVYKVEKL